MKSRWLSILLIPVLLAACIPEHIVVSDNMPTGTPAPGGFSVAKSTKSRIAKPQVPENDLQELVQGNNEFALQLYQQLQSTQDGNLIYSPYSISQALAMTYAGARSETETQMASTLRFTLPKSALHPAFNALGLELDKRAELGPEFAESAFRLRIANSLWGQKDYTFLPEFLDTLAENYAAGMSLLDFISDPEAARAVINQWVYDQTEQKIKDLLPEGSITPDTRLVLTNAIYFKAAWANEFDKSSTQEAPFTLLDGSQVQAQMMNIQERFAYASGDGYQVVELPYVGNLMVMTVILPDSGKFEEIQSKLSAAWLDEVTGSMGTLLIQLGFPKFKFEAAFSLSEILKQMGMPLAFTDQADLSGMDGTDNLYISDVIHKAVIAVDEEGTEAAAATAVIVMVESMPMPEDPIYLTIDRPFLFLIRDRGTGSILFAGRVLDPTAGN